MTDTRHDHRSIAREKAIAEGVKDVVPYALLMGALLLFPQGLGARRSAGSGA